MAWPLQAQELSSGQFVKIAQVYKFTKVSRKRRLSGLNLVLRRFLVATSSEWDPFPGWHSTVEKLRSWSGALKLVHGLWSGPKMESWYALQRRVATVHWNLRRLLWAGDQGWMEWGWLLRCLWRTSDGALQNKSKMCSVSSYAIFTRNENTRDNYLCAIMEEHMRRVPLRLRI